MDRLSATTRTRLPVLGVCLLMAGTCWGAPAELYLHTGVITNTMPDGRPVVMWGFAQDSGPTVQDGLITIPGPTITLNPGPQSLLIHLTNNLPEPVSIVIPGQPAATGDPARNPDGRARSFTHEAPPGGTADFTWPNLQPGTYLYHSGSHVSVQVQMGLYGCLKHDSGYGEIYPGVLYNSDVALLYAEIDPALHDAVATGNYGTNKAMTSTVNYAPKYFLINGQCYTNGLTPVHAGRPGDTVLLRFLNAGIQTHVPIMNNAYVRLVAEDGFAYPYPKDQYSMFLAAGKTIDALFTSGISNSFALYDRRLSMMNATASPGGMLTYLDVSSPPSEPLPPLWWLQQYFGGGPYPTNLAPAYIAGLNPTNPASIFRISAIAALPGSEGIEVFFDPTTTNRFYSLDFTTNLLTGPWVPIYSNVPGSLGSMYLIDSAATNDGSGFFRVNVELP